MRWTSEKVSTLAPSTLTKRSPGWNPAMAAGPPGRTSATIGSATILPYKAKKTEKITTVSNILKAGPAKTVAARFHTGCV